MKTISLPLRHIPMFLSIVVLVATSFFAGHVLGERITGATWNLQTESIQKARPESTTVLLSTVDIFPDRQVQLDNIIENLDLLREYAEKESDDSSR